VNGQLGQLLAVETDASNLQSVDEPTVVHAHWAKGSVDADNPHPTVLTLLFLTTAELIKLRLHNGFISLAQSVPTNVEETLRTLEELTKTGLANLTTLYAGHGDSFDVPLPCPFLGGGGGSGVGEI
jgi:hypothetical protein